MLKIYCDGACSGNPGPGGWAFVIPKLDIEVSDYEEQTTNNRMEITAAMKAVEFIYNECPQYMDDGVEIITDSQYVVNTMTKGWKKNKNLDLWSSLEYYLRYFLYVNWTWVKGHADNKYNKRCDELAVNAYKQQQEFEKRRTEEEQKRELDWYGKKVPLDSTQKVIIEFSPYEKYDVGKNHFVNILKCTAIDAVYAAEADNNELLCIGSYSECRQALQNYKMLVEDNFRRLPF